MVAVQKKSYDITSGPIFKRMLLFALPLMATNLLQTLYNSADMMVVALSSEPDAVGAIGSTAAFINLVVNLFIGFSVGANVMVARHLGAKQEDAVRRAVHTSILLSVLMGTGFGVLGFFLARPVLMLMGAETALLDLGTTYCKIYFCGAPFLALTNYTISIFRAKGDTKTPLVVLSLSGLLNVLLNLFFVLALGLSVEGVALATAISNAASALVLLILLAKDNGACRFSPKLLRIDARSLREIMYVGLPAGIQSALFSLSNILIQSSLLQINNAMYPPATSAFAPVVRGNSAAANLEGFAFAIVNAIHQAAVTFVGQNAGAEKYDRVVRVTRSAYVISMLCATGIALLLFFLRTPLFALYGVVDGAVGTLEHTAYESGTMRLVYHLLPFPVYAFMDVGAGVARGLKKSISSTVLTLIGTCALRVIWLLIAFPILFSLECIFISYPMSWLITGVAQALLVFLTLRPMLRAQQSKAAP